jgi:benzoylformate decarboxylase
MTRMTGKRALMETLKAEGVEYIFGNPGTSETPIMDELEHHPELKYKLVMQEGVAMGMADGYARATGKPAFVNLHIETGLANGISLLHNAAEGGTPLVLTAGNLDIRELARGRTDLAEMVRLFTKFTAEATHPEQVPTTLRRAFNEARTPPTGPTFVAFSANALDDEGEMDIFPSPQGYFRTAPDAAAVQAAADILVGAKRPVILVGDRVAQSGAAAEAVRLAELTGASVYSSSYSEMNFPSTHPQYLGGIKIGFPESMGVLGAADAVLAIGKLATVYYMFSDPAMRFFGDDTKLIHLDQDSSRVGSSQPTDVGILADPKTGLAMLAEAVEANMSGSAREAAKGRADDAATMKAAMDEAVESRLKDRWDMSPMSADRMMSEIAKVLPSDSIIINDAVTSGTALLNSFDFTEPGSIFGGRGGALGWGMGGAMGVKLANPDKPVVAIDGDGSAMMTVQGLWTAASDGIPVVYVICNNSEYRILKVNMDIYKDLVLKQPGADSRYMGMDFPVRPNFAQMAEAMGVYGRRIDDPEQVGPAMTEALALGKPALLDIIIGNQ